MNSKLHEPPKDPFTAALAAVLTAAVRDRWQKYPTKGDFYKAAADRTGVNPETIARLLRAETSIRVDYLIGMAELLGTKASELVSAAEAMVIAEQGGDLEPEPPLSADVEDQLRELRNGNRLGDDKASG